MFEIKRTITTRLAGDIEIHERSADAIREYCKHYNVNIDEFMSSAVRAHLRYFAEQQTISYISAAALAALNAKHTSDEERERIKNKHFDIAWQRARAKRASK